MSWNLLKIELARNFGLGLSVDDELTENPPYYFQFVPGAAPKHDAVGLQVLALTILEHSLWTPVLIDQSATQAVTGSSPRAKTKTCTTTRSGMDFYR